MSEVTRYHTVTTVFVLINEEKEWINFQKPIYGKFFGKCIFFRNFEDIPMRKTLLDFNLPLKKQAALILLLS